ncbi:anthranilate phosphoribosyltransferase family protein [Leptothermofonsia sichuanensis E412]|uniref:anthranilate phosphoribosyltransferase family protein n=1 Tax=Leptothermofonsia sichuanensis TaxID=2917832 RepID=UPI001CA5FDE9|nr:anthranilate phosphoribosyltransferase family protein [Leptothermofonsia sichuanensis]QZZ18589.1 anthranilate phosphoribosyltransferase family protein [Leptothermofonsia sichuanensis E412]
MSHAFRELLRKVGSGLHTGENLSRQEAAAATRMMLLQEATPAQIGAFMIAHRIRRPTGEELAGMLDAYDELGPKLSPISTGKTVTVLGIPYDGRSRTAPVTPLIALILATAGCPVLMHGGDRMPTKEGEPLIHFWQGLGVDWTQLLLEQVQHVLETTGIGFIYLPLHFPLAYGLVPYREQIGKRPPFATMELMWCPYGGDAQVVSGFVHPPTEGMFQAAFAQRGISRFTTVKGLEGSCDLPRERTAIIGLSQPETGFERLHLHPRDYGFEGKNVPLDSVSQVVSSMQAILQGGSSDLTDSVLWSSSFFLWRCGVCASIAAGVMEAQNLLSSGQVMRKLREVQQAIAPLQLIL